MNWKHLLNYSRYEISDTGLIRNIRNNKCIKGCISQNYICVALYPDEGKKKSLRLHRLVAMLFCTNENNYDIVNHKDGNTLNNNATNLEWTTSRQNTQHAAKLGKIGKHGKHGKHLRSVRRKCISTGEIKEYKSIVDAYRDNTHCIKHLEYIISVCSGKQKTSGGYEWEYIKKNITHQEPENSKCIPNYTNYLITSDGKIYSKKRKQFLNPSKNQAGYLIIDLHADNYDENKNHDVYTRKRASKRKKFRMHRLVAEQFIDNPNPTLYTEVNHKNKDRTDNRVENLEWVSTQQNAHHAHSKAICQFTKEGKFIKTYSSIINAATTLGMDFKNISSSLRRGWKYSAGGFRWCYCTDNGTYVRITHPTSIIMLPLMPSILQFIE